MIKKSFFLLLNEKQLIDIAFRKAEKEARKAGSIREREITRINVSAQEITERLKKAIKNIPERKRLPLFYQELLSLIVDEKKLLETLAHFNKSIKIIEKLKKKILNETKKEKNWKKITRKRKEFYGRLNSVIRKLKESILEYNKAQKMLLELPDINVNEFTIVLAGYPNTGKTTIMQRLTKSRPEIASYPFTTKKINKSTFMYKYFEVQILDTPGLLDRPIEKRNKIEKKAILALKHLNGIIVFVVDPTNTAGNTLEKQKKLLEELRKEFKEKELIIVINKVDIASKTEISKALEEFKNAVMDGNNLSGQKIRDILWEKLDEALKKGKLNK